MLYPYNFYSMNKYNTSAAALVILAGFNAAQTAPTAANIAAAVLFSGIAAALLLISAKQERAAAE